MVVYGSKFGVLLSRSGPRGSGFAILGLLGGSWVVINGVVRALIWVITIVT